MSHGAEVHARQLIVQQAAVFTFDGDLEQFIQTGAMGKRRPIKSTPELEQKIAEIKANGGQLIIDGAPHEPQEAVTNGNTFRCPSRKGPRRAVR